MDIIDGLLLKIDFPNLNWNSFSETSKRTTTYYCVAFAAGDESQPWWPNKDGHYWPTEAEGVPQEESISAFVAAFGIAKLGYVPCDNANLEADVEKIAIYADSATKKPKHAARQLVNGKWASKLGAGIDIQHDSLAELAEPLYGDVACFLKRPREFVPSNA
jgi:hypothetical protein